MHPEDCVFEFLGTDNSIDCFLFLIEFMNFVIIHNFNETYWKYYYQTCFNSAYYVERHDLLHTFNISCHKIVSRKVKEERSNIENDH